MICYVCLLPLLLPAPAGTEFMQCAVENVPLPDGSLDAVLCMYAFHEMPEEARSAAAAEMLRLLKPGGLVVLTDSVQLGDRPQVRLDRF